MVSRRIQKCTRSKKWNEKVLNRKNVALNMNTNNAIRITVRDAARVAKLWKGPDRVLKNCCNRIFCRRGT